MDQQPNPYYNQQSYPQSNVYIENSDAYVEQSQQQIQYPNQRSESLTGSSLMYQHPTTFQHYSHQPHSQGFQAIQQHQFEPQFNFSQRVAPPSHLQTAQHPYASNQHEQYPLRHVHSQSTLQPHPSATLTAYGYDAPSRTSQSTSDSSATYSDPLPSFRGDSYAQHATNISPQVTGPSTDYYGSTGVPRLPPIFQVERQQVTSPGIQTSSANRRRNEATFECPVPGCGSTFTRRFNLKGHLRSHTSERPFACEWPGCDKAFARQHDCKRHYQLHSAKAGTYLCQGCGKSFSRMDALNRHLRSEGGFECRPIHYGIAGSQDNLRSSPQADSPSPSETTDGEAMSETYN